MLRLHWNRLLKRCIHFGHLDNLVAKVVEGLGCARVLVTNRQRPQRGIRECGRVVVDTGDSICNNLGHWRQDTRTRRGAHLRFDNGRFDYLVAQRLL